MKVMPHRAQPQAALVMLFVTVIGCHLSPACSAAHQTALIWGRGSSLELLSGLCGLDLWHSLSPEIRRRKELESLK